MNSFADHVTTPLKAALGRLCALTSLSIMEILYALAAVGAVAYTVWSVIAVVKARGHRGRRVYSALLGAADGILTVYVLFCLMWGVNYWTDSFQDRSGITAQPVAAEDLKNVTAYFAERLSETADTVPRDENGVYAVPKEQILSESRSVYGGVTELFPFLEFPDTGVKAVRCSRIMSVMGFTGVYFACVGESNVNVDSPACLLPSTIAHELAHQRGVAWEQECNFLGVLASVTSGMPDYIYSGWLLGFIHLGNALYETDPEAYWAIRGTLPAAVETDLRDNSAYWDQFRDNVVEKVSDTVYNAALKSYGDANGMKSYSMVVELLAAVGAVAYTVWSVIAVVKARGHRGRRVYSALLGAADGILTVYVLFCLMWGVNYWTDSFQDRSGITAQPVAAEDLKNVTAYFAERLSETADTVPRDENGVYAVPKEQILSESRSVYGGVTELFPFLEFPDTGVKAVRCSRIMSVMGFTGVYFACVGESNVNVDSPACLLPSTIAHELAHQRGVAWEQECNFLGVLASVTSGMPDYIYSGWLLGFIHLGNALYETDPEAYWAIRGTLPAAVETDLRDNSAYWDQFRDNVVEKVSDTVYNAALKSYGDANGMKSYSMVVELLVAYYKDLV